MKSKEQSFWTTFAIVMVVLIGGAGFYCLKSRAAYKSADDRYLFLKNKAEKLMGKDITPNAENVTDLTEFVRDFQQEVNTLHDGLRKFQKPLEPIPDTQFPQLLRGKLEEFQAYANGVPAILPEEFYLGMGAYQTSIPPQPATGILKFQLESIDHLLRLIIDSGSDELFALQREPTPLELGGEDPEETALVAKYTVTLSFRTSHEGFRQFVNLVSNDDQFYYIIRVLRVDNEAKEGPIKNVDKGNVFRDRDGKVVLELPEGADADEFILEDAHVIFGDEALLVTAVIDLCRFPSRDTASSAAADGEATP